LLATAAEHPPQKTRPKIVGPQGVKLGSKFANQERGQKAVQTCRGMRL